MTTANGQVLKRYEMLGGRYDEALGRVLDSKQNRHHGFFHFDGKRIGNVGNDGIEREDYVQQMARSRDAEVSPDSKYRQYTPVAGADFDENYLPINASYPDIAPGRYTVRAGDTLRSVARTLWGDGAMWYLLAQANGLQIQPEAALKEFTTLTVPNVVTNFHNTSETNRVYNAAWALGDTSPSLPAPQLPPAQSSGKCGGMGMLLTIVVAVAATVLTAGAAAIAMGAVSSTAGIASAGMAALSGGLVGGGVTGMGFAAAGAAALGGAAGSIAGQGMGMALGNRDSFNWREVAMSAVGSAIGSGVGQSGLGQLTFGLQGNGASIASAMARSAITSSALQAVSMGAGSQGRFSWRAVAASALGAGVGAGMGAAFGAPASPGGVGMTPAERFGELARGTVYGIAAGSAASAIGSGRVMARQVAVDAFGNALGNGLAEMSGRGSSGGPRAASGGFPLYADSSGRLEPVIVTATPLGDDDEIKLYYGDRLIQSFFENTPTGAAATGLGDGPRQPSSSAVNTNTGAAPERRGMSIDRPAAYLPGRGASARLGHMYDVNVRRDPTRSVLAQPNGDEAGDRAIRELRLRQQALLAPPIDPLVDLPLMAAGPAVQAARWLGRTALASAETVGGKFLVPQGLGNAGGAATSRMAELQAKWGDLTIGERRALLDSKSETTWSNWLDKRDAAAKAVNPNAHFLEKHGPSTTLLDQEIRASTKLAPDGSIDPAFRDSTRFLSSQDMGAAMQRADSIFQLNGGVNRAYSFNMEGFIGEGYTKSPGLEWMFTTNVNASFRNGQPYTVFPLLRPIR